jgi:hypothetical protein
MGMKHEGGGDGRMGERTGKERTRTSMGICTPSELQSSQLRETRSQLGIAGGTEMSRIDM